MLDAAADEDGGVDDAAADEDGGPDDAAADEDAAEGATAAGVLDPGVPAVVAEALEDAAGGDTNPDAPPEPLAPTVDIHHDDPEFGYRLITDELRNLGHAASENRVGRLCTQQQIYWAFAKKKGLRNRPGPAVHDDRVKRKFTAEAANTLWLTDITEHRTDEGKLYLCAIKEPLVQPNRRLLDRFQHEGHACGPGIALCDRRPAARGLHPALGPRIANPVEKVRPDVDEQRSAWVDGPGRCVRRLGRTAGTR